LDAESARFAVRFSQSMPIDYTDDSERFVALALEASLYLRGDGLTAEELGDLAAICSKDRRVIAATTITLRNSAHVYLAADKRFKMLPGAWRFTLFSNGFFTPEYREPASLDTIVRILRDKGAMTRDALLAEARRPLWQTQPRSAVYAIEILCLSGWLHDQDGTIQLARNHLAGAVPSELLKSYTIERNPEFDAIHSVVARLLNERPPAASSPEPQSTVVTPPPTASPQEQGRALNQSARRLLSFLHACHVQVRGQVFTISPNTKTLQEIGLTDTAEFMAAANRLIGQGLALQVTASGVTITPDGVMIAEDPDSLDRILPINARELRPTAHQSPNHVENTRRSQPMIEPKGLPIVKYTVFVSSTKVDLSDQRERVASTILKAGHIPCGMEQFAASNDRGWGVITETIDLCDYYIVIAAGKYGTVDPSTGLSWTEREFNYALERKVPILGFVRDDAAIKPVEKETDPAAQAKLASFIARIKNHGLSPSWKDSGDLCEDVAQSLTKEIARDVRMGCPRAGWYRGDSLPMASTSDGWGKCGNVYWLANNTIFVAYALLDGNIAGAMTEWDNAIHHAEELPVPEEYRTRLRKLRHRNLDDPSERAAIIQDLRRLGSDMGAFVAKQQPGFR
jgi:hypothetical protein